MLLNTKSQVMHKMTVKGEGTVCPYVKDHTAPHFVQQRQGEAAEGEYTKCPRCFDTNAALIADIDWDLQEAGLVPLDSPSSSSSGTTVLVSTTDDAASEWPHMCAILLPKRNIHSTFRSA